MICLRACVITYASRTSEVQACRINTTLITKKAQTFRPLRAARLWLCPIRCVDLGHFRVSSVRSSFAIVAFRWVRSIACRSALCRSLVECMRRVYEVRQRRAHRSMQPRVVLLKSAGARLQLLKSALKIACILACVAA